MEPSEIAKQTLHFSKVAFDNTYKAILLLQEQSQRIIDIYLDQLGALRQEGKGIAETLTQACITNREEFKRALENTYTICASFFPATAPCGPSSPWPSVSGGAPERSDRPPLSLPDAKKRSKN